MSQSGSLSSGTSSQYSSGYCSDSSIRESVTSARSRLPHPIVTYKRMEGHKLLDISTFKRLSVASPQSSSTKMSMTPKPSSNRSITSYSTSSGYHSSHKGHPSTTPHSTSQLWLVLILKAFMNDHN